MPSTKDKLAAITLGYSKGRFFHVIQLRLSLVAAFLRMLPTYNACFVATNIHCPIGSVWATTVVHICSW